MSQSMIKFILQNIKGATTSNIHSEGVEINSKSKIRISEEIILNYLYPHIV
jgi:hypothetical protein